MADLFVLPEEVTTKKETKMSDKVPVFKIGDYVRVMQTSEMVQKKLANEKGIIVGWWEAAQAWHVKLQFGTFAISSSSLMKEPLAGGQ